MADDGKGEGTLGRWSRLKQRDRARRAKAAPGTRSEESAPGAAAAAEPVEPNEAGPSGDEALPPPDLPDIDSLDKDSDYTPFMAANVPDELRRAALRKLWSSDPVLANLDGLNDYDEDFSMIGTVAREIASKYRVGKGYNEADDDLVEDDGDLDTDDGDDEAAAARTDDDNPVRPPAAPGDAAGAADAGADRAEDDTA